MESDVLATANVDNSVVIWGATGFGKSHLLALLHDAGKASPGWLQQNIAELDGLRSDLVSANVVLLDTPGLSESARNRWPSELLDDSASYGPAQALAAGQPPVSWYSDGAVPTTTYAGSWSASPCAVAPSAIPAAWLGSPADRCWFSSLGPSFPADDPLSSDQLISFNAAGARLAEEFAAAWLEFGVQFDVQPAARRHLPSIDSGPDLARLTWFDADVPAPFAPGGPLRGFVLTTGGAVFRDFREDLLRLMDGVRATLYRMLILVLSALSRRPDVRDFILVLLATSRRFGHRGEPEDHGFPALTPIPVVIGEAACSV